MTADADALGEARVLFVEHARDLHAYAARRVGSDLADDVVAETFRRAIESTASFDPSIGSPRGWLFGIATNVLRRHWRTERRRLDALDALDGASDTPTGFGVDPLLSVPSRVDAAGEAGRVMDAVRLLDPSDHELLVLVAWERMTSEEVGEVLGIAPGTVRSRLHRIRRHLDAARHVDPNTEGDFS